MSFAFPILNDYQPGLPATELARVKTMKLAPTQKWRLFASILFCFQRLGTMKGLLSGCMWLLPAIAFSQDFTGQFPYHKKTEYFDFYYLRDSPRIPEITRFADGFVQLVNRDFFNTDFDYPIRVLVFEDRAQYKQFLTQQLHIADPPNFGIYIYRNKFFATYEDSGLGTFAHEILHPLVEKNLKGRPQWAMEGIPTFFEKFYGYWRNGELVTYWGYQNPWRIQQLGTNLTQLDLKQIIAEDGWSADFNWVEHNESSCRMASVFLWQQGRLKRFLTLIATHDKAGYPTYFEAAMEMPVEKIIPLWQDYLNDVTTRRTKILHLPASSIFDDGTAFTNFVKANDISLEQPKTAR
jgi:hypothetical protein